MGVDFYLSYLEGVVLVIDPDGDQIDFAAGAELPEGVFHIVLRTAACDYERTGLVFLEEGFQYLPSLVLGRSVGLVAYADFQIIREPG